MRDNLNKRLSVYSNDFEKHGGTESGKNSMETRLNALGGSNQWIRMREDKLRGLKKALLYSYQAAIVSKYNPTLQQVEINQFRSLINHDKLKVDYEDKIISIPFQEKPINGTEVVQTNFHNGTVFKWLHGNKEEWTPDTYWIVLTQYSDETAYFRGQIRRADSEIVIVDEDGNEHIYRGWITGPNETDIVWNVKKGIIWNDMNYHKQLYISKDETTQAFFKRFDRVIIDGEPWEIQAWNGNYGAKSGNKDTGILRVALKETYSDTKEIIAAAIDEVEQTQPEETYGDPRLVGQETVYPFDTITYKLENVKDLTKTWKISNSSLAKIKKVSEDNSEITVEVLSRFSNSKGFDVSYGEDLSIHVVIGSL